MTAPPPVSEASTTTPSAQTPRRPALRVPRVLRVTTEWWTTALPSSTDLQESTPCDGQGAGEGVGGRSADPRALHGGSGSVPPAAPLQATPSLQSGEAELAAGVPHLPPPASERSLGSSARGPQDEEGPGSPAPRSSGLQPTGWWVSFPFTCLCTNFCSRRHRHNLRPAPPWGGRKKAAFSSGLGCWGGQGGPLTTPEGGTQAASVFFCALVSGTHSPRTSQDAHPRQRQPPVLRNIYGLVDSPVTLEPSPAHPPHPHPAPRQGSRSNSEDLESSEGPGPCGVPFRNGHFHFCFMFSPECHLKICPSHPHEALLQLWGGWGSQSWPVLRQHLLHPT